MRDRLRSLALFADIDDEHLDRLVACASEFQAPAGQALIERGDPGAGLFVLEDGYAVVEAPEGRRELRAGDVFGERALVGDGGRTARVRALTNVRCLAIPRADLESLMAAEPRVADRLRNLSA